MTPAADSPRDFEFSHALPPGPFRHTITVGWGDADPARIAYTANIPAWALRAQEAWAKACLGIGWYEMNLDLGMGSPFVELRCTFHSPITPREPLLLEVTVSRIGRSSLATRVEGYQDRRRHCFTGSFVCVFTDSAHTQAVAIPERMRANIRSFAERQGREFADAMDPDA